MAFTRYWHYASQKSGHPSSIDISIGSDYCYDFITGEIIHGDGGPVAISSGFGLLVSGPTIENFSYVAVSTTNLIIESPLISQDYVCAIVNQDANSELTRPVQRFLETEAIGIKEKSNPSESNIACNIHFLDSECRYEVRVTLEGRNISRFHWLQ